MRAESSSRSDKRWDMATAAAATPPVPRVHKPGFQHRHQLSQTICTRDRLCSHYEENTR
ncbi:Hypothetical predicted protein, partial [Pelobates cultripes]